ncbi:MAG: hypothetical protein WC159_11940 [Sphaerochaetaceae bacterium]
MGLVALKTDILKVLEEGQNETTRIDASCWKLEAGDNVMDAVFVHLCLLTD